MAEHILGRKPVRDSKNKSHRQTYIGMVLYQSIFMLINGLIKVQTEIQRRICDKDLYLTSIYTVYIHSPFNLTEFELLLLKKIEKYFSYSKPDIPQKTCSKRNVLSQWGWVQMHAPLFKLMFLSILKINHNLSSTTLLVMCFVPQDKILIKYTKVSNCYVIKYENELMRTFARK